MSLLTESEKVLFDGDEIVRVTDTLDLTKVRFKKDEKTLDEFLKIIESIAENPDDKRYAWFFRAYQRLYAAIKMFGRVKPENPTKEYRWRLLDDPIVDRERGALPGGGKIMGKDEEFNLVAHYIKRGAEDVSERGFVIALLGPVATGKSNVVKLLDNALSAFGTFEEGKLYTVKFNWNELRYSLDENNRKELTKFLLEKLGSEQFFERRCTTNDNALRILFALQYEGIIDTDLDSLIDKINSRLKYSWHKIEKSSHVCPACRYMINVIREVKEKFENVDVKKVIKFVSLKTYGIDREVRAFEIRPPDKRSSREMNLLEGYIDKGKYILVGMDEKYKPLYVSFGLAGENAGYSPQGSIIYFSELFKYDEESLSRLLDVIQDNKIMVEGMEVPLDVVFIASSNVDELLERISKSIKAKTIERRSHIVVFGYPTVADDVAKLLKNKIFRNVDYHIPPKFLERLLSFFYVLSTIEEPKTEKINIVEKALIYNGEYPHGLSDNIEILVERLRNESKNKDLNTIEEGVRIGIPISLLQELASKLGFEIYERWNKLSEKERFDKPCVALLEGKYAYIGGIRGFLEDFVKSSRQINEKTKKRILEEILPILFDPNEKYGLYLTHLARDVHLATMGFEDLLNTAITYISMIKALVNKKYSYKDSLSGYERYVDERFVKEIEDYMKVPTDYRERFVLKFTERLKQLQEIYPEKDEKEIFKIIVESMFKEDRNFRIAIEQYVIRHYLSEKARDISSVYTPQNKTLMENLKKMGYCEYCAAYAISIATELRPGKK